MWDYEDNSVFLRPEFTTLHCLVLEKVDRV